MDGGQILLSYIKVWVILLSLSATLRNSKLAAKNTEQDKIRKLAAENSGTSASFKTRILVHQVVVILICPLIKSFRNLSTEIFPRYFLFYLSIFW